MTTKYCVFPKYHGKSFPYFRLIQLQLKYSKEDWLNYSLYEKGLLALIMNRFNEITFAKKIITALTVSTLIPIYYLIEIFEVGYMDLYFYVSLIILIFFLQKLWKSNGKPDYLKLHNILKFLVVSGVFCIVLINPSVLLHGKKIVETIVR